MKAKTVILALGAVALLGVSGMAMAQRDPAYAAARAEGLVGEQPDGYLSIVGAATPALRTLVNSINIQRKAAYTQKAQASGATVEQMCTGERVLHETIERFGVLGIDRVIFTKLDESLGFGVILSCLQKANARLSYITTGQSVPDDIEVADRRLVADMVLRGGLGLERSGTVSAA